MADGAPKAPYADLPPRDITDADLQFLSDYTGERNLDALRQHVLEVWHAVEAKACCLCCVGFLRSVVRSVPPVLYLFSFAAKPGVKEQIKVS